MISTPLTHLKRAGTTYAGVTVPLAFVPDSGVTATMALAGIGVAALSYGYFTFALKTL